MQRTNCFLFREYSFRIIKWWQRNAPIPCGWTTDACRRWSCDRWLSAHLSKPFYHFDSNKQRSAALFRVVPFNFPTRERRARDWAVPTRRCLSLPPLQVKDFALSMTRELMLEGSFWCWKPPFIIIAYLYSVHHTDWINERILTHVCGIESQL